MAACPSCHADGVAPGARCPRCGAGSVPDLQLDVPTPAPRPPPSKKKVAEEPLTIELGVDPHAHLHAPQAPSGIVTRAGAAPVPAVPPPPQGPVSAHRPPAAPTGPAEAENEDAFQARMLADYGEPPKSWFMAPLYAYRVYARREELKRALAGRREESAHAQRAAEDAAISVAEKARPVAAGVPDYARPLEELRSAEELLRSRDHVLAREQDAHRERLQSIDQRIAKLEAELAAARRDDHAIAEELSQMEDALERASAKLKRAEIELRTATTVQSPASSGKP